MVKTILTLVGASLELAGIILVAWPELFPRLRQLGRSLRTVSRAALARLMRAFGRRRAVAEEQRRLWRADLADAVKEIRRELTGAVEMSEERHIGIRLVGVICLLVGVPILAAANLV